jgi:hypothetical protein
MGDTSAKLRSVGGEFTLIVVGVLVALLADGFVERARDRAALDGQLEVLAVELHAARELALAHIDEEEEASGRLQYLARVALGEVDPSPDSLRLLSAVFGGVEGYRPALPVLHDLQSSGMLREIQEPELRSALATVEVSLQSVALLESREPQRGYLFDPFIMEEFPMVLDRIGSTVGEYPRLVESEPDWKRFSSPEGRRVIALQSVYANALRVLLGRLSGDLETAIGILAGR